MDPRNDIVKELQELKSPLAHMPRMMPYAVPEDYFSSFSVASVFLSSDPTLTMPKTVPFEVPQHYFENFAATILERVEQPVFGKATAPFAAPAGYFDGFAERMLATARTTDEQQVHEVADMPPQKQPKVIPLRTQWSALRWAAAAVLILGIGIGSFMKFGGNDVVPLSAARQLAQLDKNVIRNYVQQNIDDFDTEMLAENNSALDMSPEKSIHALDKQDIQQYLDDAGWKEETGIN